MNADEQSKQSLDEWLTKEKTVTLTRGEWSTLTTYILMTTNYRKEEASAWERLSHEKNEDGTPRIKAAESNMRFWQEMNHNLDLIRKKIEGYKGEDI